MMPPFALTPDQVVEAIRLYHDELWSLPELGRRYGCHHSSVRAAFRRHSIPIRSGREASEALRERERRAVEAKMNGGQQPLPLRGAGS